MSPEVLVQLRNGAVADAEGLLRRNLQDYLNGRG